MAGYPIVTGDAFRILFVSPCRILILVSVPLGFYPDNVTIVKVGPQVVYPAPGVPFGLCFIGTAFSDFDLIGFGFAYEQKTRTRLARKAFDAAIPKTQLQDIVGRQQYWLLWKPVALPRCTNIPSLPLPSSFVVVVYRCIHWIKSFKF